MTAPLVLGCCDPGRVPDAAALLRPLYETGMDVRRLRGEKDDEWVSFRAIAAPAVGSMQEKLQAAGFLPNPPAPGVFDYRTLSAVRLFQEYVRSVEGITEIGAPDGVVGPRTLGHLDLWAQAGKRCEWADRSPDNGTPAFRYWIRALSLYQAYNKQRPVTRVVQLTEAFASPSDTVKIARWNVDRRAIHLIGIRRHEWRKESVRRNDDVFVLLVNGLAFGFAGSTDPNPHEAGRPDEPYLVRGQHQYRFGWHKISDRKHVYRALRPVGPGVLTCRDHVNDDAFTDEDLAQGLSVNPTINIHWSGAGTSNWSAGCQVIGGRRYVNHRGSVVDCSAFASPGYVGLGAKTRGAYNVMLDLITVFAPSNAAAGARLAYTLLYEGDLALQVSVNQTLGESAKTDLPAAEVEPFTVARLVAALAGP